jgi:uncharacterized repeat protein (TIGR03803 family)
MWTTAMRGFCNIIGGLLIVLGPFAAIGAAQAGHEKVLYGFSGGADGNDPDSRLVMDSEGNLYGTTFDGGASNAGTVFKVRPNGVQSVLYSFTGGKDGGFPTGDLILETDNGGLVGTTQAGGDHNVGTIFTVDPQGGGETVDYSFTGGSDGANPVGGLFEDGSFNLYGTTKNGGDSGFGTVFELVPFGGGFKVLHTFTAGSDGANPEGSLVMDADGNLYGTTLGGGALNQGTVFRIKPDGKEKVLHSFDGANDGRFPTSGLAIDSSGNLYGTLPGGGQNIAGTLYRMSPSGRIKVLHAFSGGVDGSNPVGTPLLDGAGDIYGVTFMGGAGDASVGTVFRLSPSGKEKVLHSFDADVDIDDGFKPSGGLIMDAGGTLYGVTAEGGGNGGGGTVFRVNN